MMDKDTFNVSRLKLQKIALTIEWLNYYLNEINSSLGKMETTLLEAKARFCEYEKTLISEIDLLDKSTDQ